MRVSLLPTAAVALAFQWFAGCSPEDRVVQTFPGNLHLDGIDLVSIEVEDGDLTLEGGDGAEDIVVELDLVTPKTGDGKDDKAIEGVHMELRDMGDGSARLYVWMDPDVQKYSLHARVAVPADIPLEVTMNGGDTGIQGCGDVTMDDGDGEVSITDMVGTVSLTDKGGAFVIDGIDGSVIVDDGKGDLEVLNVDGDVEVDDGAGDMYIAHVTGTATIRDGAGDIHVEDIGTLNLESDSSGGLLIE